MTQMFYGENDLSLANQCAIHTSFSTNENWPYDDWSDCIPGCTDETAFNYNSEANTDDGSCVAVVNGCIDETTFNYNSEANTDDGSCIVPLSIGDVLQGAYIFYIDYTSENYLVAAMEDIGAYEWGCKGTNLPEAQGQGIGTGYQNTLDIVESCSDTPIAASEALAYDEDGYSDWFLPSKYELINMYNSIGQGSANGNIGGFSNSKYWSSSENSINHAWYVHFNNGESTMSWTKNSLLLVRPIRFVEVAIGCTDETAFNYDSEANTDDGSCIYPGCTNTFASNYNEEANADDGSCVSWEEIANALQSELDNVVVEDGIGQDDVDAAYAEGAASVTPEDGIGQDDVDAAYEDGVTSVPTQNIPLDLPEGWSMFGYTCLDSVDAMVGFSEISDKIEIVKDEWGLSYLPSWDFNAMGSLQFSEGYQIKMIEGVDGFQFCSTITPEDGITQADLDALAESYEGWCESDIDNDGICDVDEVSGCMDPSSCNYMAVAEIDDGSCEYVSCSDECGVPNGDNSTCLDCAGVVNGTSEDLGCGCGNPSAQAGYDCDGNQLPEIGALMNGGIIFYIDESGEHGLVAALEDLEGTYEWGCYGGYVDGADGQAIGTGYQNTLDIVSGCSETPIAASEALAYESGDYSDWYLPSKNELYEMYNTIGNGGPEGNIGGFSSNWYWSSSESYSYNGPGAWSVHFNDGYTNHGYKYDGNRVRVIRAF